MKDILVKLLDGRDLTQDEAGLAMATIMEGQATQAQIGCFLAALRLKGETADEIAGCALVMRQKAFPVRPRRQALVDTCGTGGDGRNTFNISTTAAFVVAGAGVPVAKHGNRSVSSKSGSADVLEALGVNIDLGPDEVARCIDEAGIGFLFAQRLHPAMRHAAGPRREIGARTLFNILGPLTNPAGAETQVLGVYDGALTEVLAGVLGRLGCRRAMVVHGLDGTDELSISGSTRVSELQGDRVRTYLVEPEDAGLGRAPLDEIRGGTAAENAQFLLDVLAGDPGPRRSVVLLNAAAALVVAGAAPDLRGGVAMAAEAIDSGRALACLETLRRVSGDLAERAAGVLRHA